MLRRLIILWLLALVACASAPGPGVGALTLRQLDDREVQLAELRGQVVLLYLLTTGCDACLADLVKLRELQRRHAERGLKVIAVAMDPDGARLVRPFAETLALPFAVALPGEALARGEAPLGPTRTVPRQLLIGRDGRLRLDRAGVMPYPELERAVLAALDRPSGFNPEAER